MNTYYEIEDIKYINQIARLSRCSSLALSDLGDAYYEQFDQRLQNLSSDRLAKLLHDKANGEFMMKPFLNAVVTELKRRGHYDQALNWRPSVS